MSTPIRIQTGSTEPLSIFVVDKQGAPLTGLTDLYFRIRRFSDGYWYDFNDDTFKAIGSVTTLESAALTQVNATSAPGLYELSGGFDFGDITNPTASATVEEVYSIIPVQTPGTSASLPGPGEVREGDFVDYIDASIASRAAPGDAMDLVANAVDAAAIATGAIDADAFATDAITATVIAADAIGSSELATSAVNEIRDSILADSTPFNGASIAAILADTDSLDTTKITTARANNLDNLDTTVSSRSSHTAADVADSVWDEAKAGHVGAGSFGEEVQTHATQAEILSDATPFAGANIDATISSRAVPGSAMALTAAAVDAIWDEPLAGHLAVGSAGKALFDAGGSGSPPTVSEIADAVWDESLAGHVTAGTAGEAQNHLDVDISSRSAPGDLMGLTTAAVDDIWDEPLAGHTDPGSTGEAQNRLDADITSRAVAGDAMDLIAGALDANALDATAVAEIADGVWDEDMSGHTTAGSAGQQQNRLDATITSRSAPGDAMDLITNAIDSDAVATSGAAEIADGVWDEPLAGHTVVGSTGEAQNRLDADISSRSVPGDLMGLTSATRITLTDDIWDEALAGHVAVGSTGKALFDASTGAGVPTATDVADAVWDESAAAHVIVGSMGQLQNRLDVNISSRAAPGAAMDLISNAIDSAALDTSGLAAIADAIWDEDITTHVGANSAGLELQNKAEPGDAMDLVTDAVDSTSLADSAMNKIVDQTWREQISDHSGVVGSTAEALNNVTAPATPSVIADAVWDELLSGHTIGGSAGEALARVDVQVSTRATSGDAMDLIADAVDSTSLALSAANEIRDTILSDSTPFAGANIDAAITSRAAQTTVNDILTDTNAIDTRLPSDPADESNQNTQHATTQAAIAALNDVSLTDVADAVWDEALAGHLTAGTTGKALDDAGAVTDPAAVADAVWDEAQVDHVTVGSMGESQQKAASAAATIDKIDSAATLDPSAAVTGSLLDRLVNKDGSKTYDQSTDSLEGLRDRIG